MNDADVIVIYIAFPFGFGFAVFGFAWLLRYTNGPFHIFRRTRQLAGIEYLEVLNNLGEKIDEVEEIPVGYFTELFSCFWCISTWISIILTTFVWFAFPHVVVPLLVILWLSGVGFSGFLHEWIDYNN